MEQLIEKYLDDWFCIETKCQYYGEPDGCNNKNGTCKAYDIVNVLLDKFVLNE